MNEVFESLALAKKLWLRLDEHFLPKRLEYLLANIPVKNMLDSRTLLRVEFVCFLQVVNEIHFTNDFVALCFVELSRLLDELLVEVDARKEPVICQFAFT